MEMMYMDYMEQSGFVFVPLHNPGDHQQITGSAQEQALGIEKFWQNQALFQIYTAVDRPLKYNIVTAVEPVLL